MRERSQRFDPGHQTMRGTEFEIFHYREPKPNGVEVHHHDFYEVYYLLDGEVAYWVEGQTYHLKPGELLLIDPLVLHRPVVDPSTPLYERIVLWINKAYLQSFAETADLTACFGGEPCRVLHLSSVQRNEMHARLSELVRESYGTEYGGKLYANGLFLQFMVELNRLARGADGRLEAREDSSPLVSQVLRLIDEHYSEELSLESIAANFFVSKYHLSHEFSRAVGTSVYRYIMIKRLLMARQLLLGGMSPSEVYGRCGFKDYTNFYRAFKAEYGVSPREMG